MLPEYAPNVYGLELDEPFICLIEDGPNREVQITLRDLQLLLRNLHKDKFTDQLLVKRKGKYYTIGLFDNLTNYPDGTVGFKPRP